jgi:sugar transferase (PEP-CTERM/EpsH1 system associated)
MHVVNSLGRGGTEFGVLKLLTGLDRQLFDHRLCTTRQFDPEFVLDHKLKDRLDVAGSPDLRLQFPLLRLKEIFEKHKPDIVHTRNWGALEGVVAARLARVPVVIHSEHGYEVDMLSGMPMRRRLFRRFAFSLADSVMTVSNELREYHARLAWIQPKRIRVMYNGVDTEKFCPSPETRLRMRQELGLAQETIVIGSVGRMVPIKNYGMLLRAAETVITRGVNAAVLLVGDGPELQALQDQARETEILRGRVIFAGASDRIPEFLNAMDMFVLPSAGEGMSNTLLEAMATSLPVVAARVGGNPEVIEEGCSGYLFAAGDSTGLAEVLAELCAIVALRVSCGGSARKRALKHFSLDVMMRRYTELYLELAIQRGLLKAN